MDRDPLLSFYIPKKDQCSVCNQFYDNIDKNEYNAKNIYFIINTKSFKLFFQKLLIFVHALSH